MIECSMCGELKPESGFIPSRLKRPGKKECRECGLISRRAWKKNNRDKMRIIESRYREKHREQCREGGRVWQENHRSVMVEAQKRWVEKNPEKKRAQRSINNAIERGKIWRPDSCEMCGAVGAVNGHHDSYDKSRRMTVTWLCALCHGWIHARRRDAARKRRNITELGGGVSR